MREENVPVSSTDELMSDGGESADRVRRFGEYRSTNTPLPAAEMEERAKCGWIPRRIGELHDVTPIEEHEPPTSEETADADVPTLTSIPCEP